MRVLYRLKYRTMYQALDIGGIPEQREMKSIVQEHDTANGLEIEQRFRNRDCNSVFQTPVFLNNLILWTLFYHFLWWTPIAIPCLKTRIIEAPLKTSMLFFYTSTCAGSTM